MGRRNPVVRAFLAFVEWLDVVVLALLLAWGIAVAVAVALNGGTAIQVLLVLILFAAIGLRWLRQSFAGDKLRDRRRR
jgi:hypothetical protein